MHPLRDKIRVVCHDLKMSPLTNLDSSFLVDIRSRIKALPSPESISVMSHRELDDLRVRAERLYFDIDNASQTRSIEYSTKYKRDKKLPTRRRPIEAGHKNWFRLAQEEKLDEMSHETSFVGGDESDITDGLLGTGCPMCGNTDRPVETPTKNNKDNKLQCRNCGCPYSP